MIDIHTHIENFKAIPDKWLSVISITGAEKIASGKFFRYMIKLLLRLRGKIASWLSCIKWLQTLGFARLGEMIDIFKIPLFQVGDVLYQEMQDAGIKLTTPLLMDLEFATTTHDKPELDYGLQVDIMNRVAKKYYGEIMPFVSFDPRRPNANEFIQFCLFDKGMLGVKMYPKLGFHPSFKSMYNSLEINETLVKFYEMAESQEIPITVHCSPGGAYSESLIGKEDERDTLVHPSAYGDVLAKFPNLRLNFAHSGGDLYKWIWYCIEYAKQYPNIVMDLAYHSDAHSKKKKEKYFEVLNELLKSDIGDRIMFGSDWSMIRHTWTIEEFLKPFKDNIDITVQDKVFYQNAIKFLFPNLVIPKRVEECFGMTYKDTPKWLASKFTELESMKGE